MAVRERQYADTLNNWRFAKPFHEGAGLRRAVRRNNCTSREIILEKGDRSAERGIEPTIAPWADRGKKMRDLRFRTTLPMLLATSMLIQATAAAAQGTATVQGEPASTLEDIIVTAQRR